MDLKTRKMVKKVMNSVRSIEKMQDDFVKRAEEMDKLYTGV